MVRHLSEKSMTLYDFTFFLCVLLTYLEDTMQKARVECGVIYECECKAKCPLRTTCHSVLLFHTAKYNRSCLPEVCKCYNLSRVLLKNKRSQAECLLNERLAERLHTRGLLGLMICNLWRGILERWWHVDASNYVVNCLHNAVCGHVGRFYGDNLCCLYRDSRLNFPK